MGFTWTPITGLNDTSAFPSKDNNFRVHLQALLQQLASYVDDTKSNKAGDTFTGDINVKKTDGYISSESPTDASKIAMHYNANTGFLHLFNASMTLVNELKLGSDGSVDFSFLSKSLGSPGYVKLPVGGLILQWGSYTVSASNSAQNITLPITFPNATLVAVGGCTSLNSFGGANAVNNSTIYVWANNTGANINWIAIGY